MSVQVPDPIIDDDGLRRLLKLPEGADLSHYRDHEGLPYLQFRHDGQAFHRYVRSEVLRWLLRRQHIDGGSPDQENLPGPSADAASGQQIDEVANDGPYLTVPQAAKLLHVGDDTIERMIRRGDLPVVEITGRGELGGRKLKRIRRETLDALMKRKERSEYSPTRRRQKRNTTPDFIGDD